MSAEVKRYGEPGGNNFPFLVQPMHRGPESIVYAVDLVEAVKIYMSYREYPPYSVRMMADNE